jgi:hypothetical protein
MRLGFYLVSFLAARRFAAGLQGEFVNNSTSRLTQA